MAKRKRSEESEIEETPDEILPPMPGGVEVVATDDNEEQDVDDILAEVGSDVRVKVSRVNPTTGNSAWVGNMNGENFSLDQLADQYGGGSYILRIMRGNTLLRKVRHEVDTSIPPRNPRAPVQPPGQQGGSSVADAMTQMMVAQMDSSRRTAELMTTMMGGIASAMTGMMQVVAAARENKPEHDPLEMIRTMAEVLKAQTPAKGAMSELKDVLALANEIRGESGGDPTLPLIGKAIETVGRIVERAPAQTVQRTAVPAQANPPMNTLPKSVTPQHEIEPTMPDIMRPWMKAAQPSLPILRMSIGKIKPASAADLIIGELDSAAFGDLINDITDGFNEGDTVDAQRMLPFAQRVIAAFSLPLDAAPWLAEVAVHCLEAANDELGDEEEELTPEVPDDTPK